MSYSYTHGGYLIGSAQELTSANQAELISRIFSNATSTDDEGRVLSGRGTVKHIRLGELGSFVIKTYLRGGLLRKLPWAVYLGIGKFRSQSEFEVLQRLLSLGVRVPKPLAWIGKGSFFKKAWLVLEEIIGERSLADLSIEFEDLAQRYCREAAAEVRKLIRAKIWHVDLHPGNVLVDLNGAVFIIDFDKATEFRGSQNRLRDLYLCRWRRAVLKYELPAYLIELFAAEVRQDYDASCRVTA